MTAAELPRDDRPSASDFAGWPPLGASSRRVVAGPVVAALDRVDADVAEALSAHADEPAPGVEPLALRLQWTRAARPPFAPPAPGQVARSSTWVEGGAMAWSTHHAALLMDSRCEEGIVLLTDQERREVALSAQNVLRVAVAWRLAVAGRGLLVHAAAVRRGEGAVVLVGPSGAGKSTAIRHSPRQDVLADDACILTEERGVVSLHPAPFWAQPPREPRLPTRPLAVTALLRLVQAARNALVPWSRAQAAAALLAHAPFREGLPGMDGRDVAARLASAPARALHLRADDSFWRMIDTEFPPPRAAAGSKR